MSTKQRELLQSLTNAEGPIKESSPLIKHEKISNTPFWIIGSEEHGWCIRYGKYSITEKYKTEEEALNRLIIEQWEIMSRMAGIIAETAIEDHIRIQSEKIDSFGKINKNKGL